LRLAWSSRPMTSGRWPRGYARTGCWRKRPHRRTGTCA
jgi:hypothetical protein